MRAEHGNWVDITEKVSAQIEAKKLVFYHNHEPIGEMDMETKEIEMYDGFQMKDHSILATDNKTDLSDHYTENCDEGWC